MPRIGLKNPKLFPSVPYSPPNCVRLVEKLVSTQRGFARGRTEAEQLPRRCLRGCNSKGGAEERDIISFQLLLFREPIHVYSNNARMQYFV